MSLSSQIILGALVLCACLALNDAESRIIPSVVATSSGEGSQTKLHCMEGFHGQLHSARWYKKVGDQDVEFYRFERSASPQKTFPASIGGVNVDALDSDDHAVVLYDLSELVNGLYTCVHTMEAPTEGSVPMRSSFTLSVQDNDRTLTKIVDESSVPIVCEVSERANRTYAYKWYKDGAEFYRYVPWRTEAPEEVTAVPSVNLNRAHSNGTHILLDNFNRQSSGLYKCVASLNVPKTASLVFEVNVLSDWQ